MTIMIEREAVLTAIGASHSPLPPSSYRSPLPIPEEQHDSAYSPLKLCERIEQSKIAPTLFADAFLFRSGCYLSEDDSIPGLDESDDDCTTISSCSSGVRSRSLSGVHVSFASVLVTEVRTRPRTKPQDVSALFYSCEETQRFRQEYRLERREAIEDELAPEETSTEHVTLTDNMTSNIDETTSTGGHRISRVVVMHEDTLETFIDKELGVVQPPLSFDRSGDVTTASEAFFDNDRFWSGQITWY